MLSVSCIDTLVGITMLVSWEAIISKAPPVVYLAYTADCSAIYKSQEGEELWRMPTSAQSWPHNDGVWPTFQEKTGRGRVKLRGQPYQRHSGTLLAHSLC